MSIAITFLNPFFIEGEAESLALDTSSSSGIDKAFTKALVLLFVHLFD